MTASSPAAAEKALEAAPQEPEEEWPPREQPPAWAPSPEFSSRFASMLGSLLVIGLFTWGTLKLVGALLPGLGRRRKPAAALMEVLERQAVAPGIQICLVRVAGKLMVLGMTEQSVTMLCEMSPDELTSAQTDEDQPETPLAAPDRAQTYKSIVAHYLSIIPGMGGSRK